MAVDTGKRLCGTLGWFTATQECGENVLNQDVDGDDPSAGMQPNAGGGSIANDGDVLLVTEERGSTTGSACEGNRMGTKASTGVRVCKAVR